MKTLRRIMLLLAMSATITGAMDKPSALKISAQRYNPFGKIITQNSSPLNDAQLIQMLKRGDYDLLQQELARGLNAEYIFDSGEFKDKSLIQVAFGNSIVNRDEIAARLLKHGANPRDLDEYIKNAIKAYSSETVKWLLDHGAKDDTAYDVVTILERGAPQGLRKEQLQKIKLLLAPKNAHHMPNEIKSPVSQPVKKQINTDLYTVLGASEEQMLLKALLAGDVKKITEYLDMGVSPNFEFTNGVAGQSLLKVAATQTLKNQEPIIDLLLSYQANPKDLQEGLALAVKRLDKAKVNFLLEKGAPVTDALLVQVKDLEKNSTQPIKQKVLAEIKTLLEKKATVVPQFNKPLPPLPVKKQQRP